jgi:enoyl-CoA hydratase
MIKTSTQDGVTVLTLARPPANALDPDFMEAILGGINEFDASEARALIVTGENNVFSAGADLFRVLEGERDSIAAGIDTMSRLFARLFTLPKPTVAAVNGHAIAGGSVLTCACDYRIAASGDHRLGFTELAVGVPFPAWALEILRFGAGWKNVRDLALMARTLSVDEALAKGIVDEVVPPEELMDRAMRSAQRLARVPAGTYAVTKRALIAPALARVEHLGDAHHREVVDLWASAEVHTAIREFLERTIGKSTR